MQIFFFWDSDVKKARTTIKRKMTNTLKIVKAKINYGRNTK
jgi:hypothetical protein